MERVAAALQLSNDEKGKRYSFERGKAPRSETKGYRNIETKNSRSTEVGLIRRKATSTPHTRNGTLVINTEGFKESVKH